MTEVQASQKLIIGELGCLKKSFEADFATAIGLLVDIKSAMSVKTDGGDLDSENQVDFDHVYHVNSLLRNFLFLYYFVCIS